jgi:hypothetical protein
MEVLKWALFVQETYCQCKYMWLHNVTQDEEQDFTY